MRDLVSTTEAAEMLGITRQRVTQLIRNNQLDGMMVGGRWLVDRASVEARRATVSRRGGRPRFGSGRDEAVFTLMNRGYAIREAIYSRRREEFVRVGPLLEKDRLPIGVFGQRSMSARWAKQHPRLAMGAVWDVLPSDSGREWHIWHPRLVMGAVWDT